MNRREFLKRMALAGLALPSSKFIFDMGKNLHRQKPDPVLQDVLNGEIGWDDYRFVQAMRRGSVMMFDNLGVTVRADDVKRAWRAFDPVGSDANLMTVKVADLYYSGLLVDIDYD